jgi:zinc protease
MSRSIKFLLVLFLIFGLILGYGQNITQAAENSVQLPDLQVEPKTLSNGLTYLIQENHSNALVAFEVIIRTGSIFEGRWQGAGMCHLIEHMLFKGTAKRPLGLIESEVKSLGGSINAYTSHQYTGITLVVPSKNSFAALEILSDMVSNPVFDSSELEKEMDVILSEIKMNQDDPQRFLSKKFWQYFYVLAPYNLPIIGIEPIFKSLKRRDVLEFYEKWYIPNNMILSIAGDVDKNQLTEDIEKTFGKIEAKPYPEYSLPDIPPQQGIRNYDLSFDVNVMHLMLGLPSVVLTHEDSAALDVLATILGQGQSSLLERKLVRNEKIAYSVQAFNYTPGFKGIFALSLKLDQENKQKVLDSIFEQFEIIKDKPLPKKMIEKAKNLYLSQYLFDQQNVQSQAKNMAVDFYYTGNVNFTSDYIKKLSNLTPKDIQQCAKKYLNKNTYVAVALIPKKQKNEYEKAAAQDINEIEEIRLDNGVRLVLRQNNKLPILNIGLFAGGGVRFEEEKTNGLFNFFSKMMLKGTKKRSAEQIAQELENLGASLSSFSGYNSFGLNLECLSKDIDKGIEIFGDVICNPNFPADEIDLLKTLVLKEIEVQNDDIFRDSFNKAKQALFSSYPYRFNVIGTKTSVKDIDRNELISTKADFLVPDNMVITVFGDFNKTSLIKKLKKMFAKLPSTQKKPKDPVFKESYTGTQKIIQNQRDKKQAVLVYIFPGCDVFSPDRQVLDLLSDLLCSSGSVLYDRIREKSGLAYTLGGASVPGLDAGFFYIYIATKPEAVDKVRSIVEEEIDNAKKNIYPEEVILTNKNYLIGQHELGKQSNGSLSFTVGLDVLYGLGPDYHKNFNLQVEQITPELIQQVAVKYFDWGKSVVLISGDGFDD